MTGIEFKINPPDFSDWAQLYKLLIDSFAYMDDRIDPPSSLHQMNTDSLRQKADEETLVLGFHDKELIACAFMREEPEFLYLGKIAVKPELRKRGILRTIIKMAGDLAKETNKQGLELETRIELTENQQTFRSLGFSIVDKTAHAGYDQPTAVTMRKFV